MQKNRPVQYFSQEYLAVCKKMKPMQTLEFLDGYRMLAGTAPEALKKKTKLISLKVDVGLLEQFRLHCERRGVKYQTQIKLLMEQWLHHP